jgi:hypothetical protein
MTRRKLLGFAVVFVVLVVGGACAQGAKHPLHGKWTFHMFGRDRILSFHKDQIVLTHTHAGDQGREYGRWDQKAKNLFTLRGKAGTLRIKFAFVGRDILKGKVVKCSDRSEIGAIISAHRIKPEKKDGE